MNSPSFACLHNNIVMNIEMPCIYIYACANMQCIINLKFKVRVRIGDEQLEQVDTMKYLGVTISGEGSM